MKEAARLLGMPYTTYVNYEKGLREPMSEVLIQIADFYGVTIDYLIGRTASPVRPAESGPPSAMQEPLPQHTCQNLPLSPEAQKIAAAYDKATAKEQQLVRLTLSDYL